MRPRMVEWLDGWLGIGSLVPDFAVLLALAIVLGVRLTVRRGEELGLDARRVFRTCLVATGVALASARLYVVVQDWDYFSGRLPEVVRIWKGGLASYGAFLGGTLAVFVAARRQRLPPGRLLDAGAAPIALMMALGRVGCFLAGCCYGGPADLPWAVRFPAGSDPHGAHVERGLIAPGQPLSAPVHPTQLYEAGAALVLCGLLARHRPRRDGESFALLFVLYPLVRYLIEFWRDDPRGTVLALSAPQFFSLASICIAGSFLLMRPRAGRARAAPLAASR